VVERDSFSISKGKDGTVGYRNPTYSGRREGEIPFSPVSTISNLLNREFSRGIDESTI
jgi:hypothetical protein